MLKNNIFSKVRSAKEAAMITYSLQKNSPDPLYISLYKCLRNDIRAGVLAGGERLPSKRAFAANLGISVITVENAYALLMDEGYVFSMPKRGFYVADLKLVSPAAAAAVPLGTDAERSGTRVLADFRSNETDPESFPFKQWTRISREIMSERQHELLVNPPGCGTAALREAIASELKAFHGMEVDPSRIVVGAGTEYLYGLLIQLLGFDRAYAAEDPGYARIFEIYRSFGVKCVRVGLDSEGLDAAALERTGASVVHVSPSHQFPSGVVMPVARRYELLGWAMRGGDRYIIEDDYDSEFRLSGRPLSALQTIDAEGRVIYMNTFTKTLASTIRVSYMVLPPALAERFRVRLGFYSCTVPTFEQYTLAGFLERGAFERHVNRMRTLYGKKRDELVELIKSSELGKKCELLGADCGLHFLMRVRTGRGDEEITAAALSAGIRLSAISEYYGDPAMAERHVFVLNYSSVKPEILPEAVRRLARVFRD